MPEVKVLNGQDRLDLGLRPLGKQALPYQYKLERTAPKDKKPKVTKIGHEVPEEEKPKLRVAAYCRVSTFLASQESSIHEQRRHYIKAIQSNSEWDFAGIYMEAGVSGTKAETRPELQRLLADCRAGKIDLILTKSISRFARNATDCLEMVRFLMSIGVNIFFEKENIHTDTMESEFMLSVMAGLAEDESVSISKNLKWGIRKRFENGTYVHPFAPYGYRKDEDGKYEIVPEEAAVVREIFYMVLSGHGMTAIAETLNSREIPSPRGKKWTERTLRLILHNEAYVGDALYQKTYKDENFRQKKNRGELDQFYDSDHHEPIIDRETFERAAFASQQRGYECGKEPEKKTANRYALSGKVFCAKCGAPMYRHQKSFITKLVCSGKDCSNIPEPENSIKNAFITMLNKLAWSQCQEQEYRVLDNYIAGIKDEEASANADRLNEIDTALRENQLALDTMTAVAMVDRFSVSDMEKKARLIREGNELRAEKTKLVTQATAVEQSEKFRTFIGLWKITDKTEDFPEEAFSEFVLKAVVASGESVTFHLTCGLIFTESLRRETDEKKDTLWLQDREGSSNTGDDRGGENNNILRAVS